MDEVVYPNGIYYFTPLHQAASQNNLKFASLFLNNSADINSTSEQLNAFCISLSPRDGSIIVRTSKYSSGQNSFGPRNKKPADRK